MLFKELNIDEKVVDDIVSVIEKSNIYITKNVNCTINGYQTDNICNIFSNGSVETKSVKQSASLHNAHNAASGCLP